MWIQTSYKPAVSCSLHTEKVALCVVHESLDIDMEAFESQFNVLFCDYQLILH